MQPAEVVLTKAQLRIHYQSLLAQLTQPQKKLKSLAIVNSIIATPQYKAAKCVLLFTPRIDEPDIWPLFPTSLSSAKSIYLPAVQELAIGLFTERKSLIKSKFGILQPASLITRDIYPDIDLVICPALAFDQQGYRLGHASGWYDRMLPRFVNAYKIGVCFDEQRLTRLPHDSFDQKVDHVISE